MAREKKHDILKGFLLFVGIVIFFIIFLEIVLRLAYPLYSNYNTEMWRYSVLLKRASSNPNVSHEHIPNTEAFLYGVDIKINSQGFRDKEYSIEKPSNTYRILVLGDSFTLGWGVLENETYSKVLERMLNENSKGKKFEVINTALGNYNTQMEYELLKEKGLKFNPDMVIVGYYPNDPELTVKFNQNSISTILKRKSYIYVFFWDRITNIKTKLNAMSSKGGSYNGYVHGLYQSDFKGKKIMEDSLKGIIETSRKNNATVVVVVLPQFFGDLKKYEFKEAYPTVANITKNNAVAIDMLPYFQNLDVKDVIISYEDAHPNKLGHSIIAKAIYDKIINTVQTTK